MKLVSSLFSLIIAGLLFAMPSIAIALPVITSVTPINGSVAGGNTVQITGSGFTGTTAIDFGNVPVVTYTVLSDTSITATAPESFAPGPIDVTVTTSAGTSLANSNDQYTYIDGTWYAYVAFYTDTNTQNFIPINLDTFLLQGSPLTILYPPHQFAITPNDQLAIIPAQGAPALNVVELGPLQVLPPISTSGESFSSVAITPNGQTAYFTVNDPLFALQPYDIASATLGTAILLPSTPFSVAITPDGQTAYVTCISNQVFPIDLATGTVGAPIAAPLTSTFDELVITPDGTKLFSHNYNGNDVTYIDLTTTPPTPHALTLEYQTGFVAMNPNGKTVYYFTSYTTLPQSYLIPVDVATLTIGSPIPITQPDQSYVSSFAVAPDGKTGYIGFYDGGAGVIYPIDLTTYVVGAPSPSFAFNPLAIVISPDQAPIASFIVTPAVSTSPSIFDASASLSPVGTIANYAWDFGDGATLNTSSPIVTHAYAVSGNYTVTLTVTNSGGTSTTQTFTGQTVSNNGGPSATTTRLVQISTLLPPINAHGFQLENKFFLQTESVNVIEWNAPSGVIRPVAYNIYADAALTDLLGVVSANGKLEFVQHNVHERSYTYYLVSVDALGDQSIAVPVTVGSSRGRHSSSPYSFSSSS